MKDGQAYDRCKSQKRLRGREPGPHAYTIYAQMAEEGGFPNIAGLFRAVAYAERVHASNHYRNIQRKGDAVTVSTAGFGSRMTPEDLQVGIDRETFEVEVMYPSYREVVHM